MISINTVCQNVRHKGNFEICRPDGSGDDLLVIFKTSALLIIDGNEIIVPPDSLIIYNMLDEQAWTEYINQDDPVIRKTLEVFNNHAAFPKKPAAPTKATKATKAAGKVVKKK